MLAREARRLSGAWLEERLLPTIEPGGFRGAFVMGSLATVPDDAEFDQVASDIDVAVIVDVDVVTMDAPQYRHGKMWLYRGCLMQSNFVPSHVLEEDEKLFGMLGLGCNLRPGRIISDPMGLLATALERVEEHWAEPRWVTHRTGRAIDFARRALEQLDTLPTGAARLMTQADVVSQFAGIVAIAHATTPTHRRALALSETLLAARGRVDLHDRMLSAIGAAEIRDGAVAAATDDAVRAVEVQLRYDDPSLEDSDQMAATMVASVSAGIRQMVNEGYVREAMLPILTTIAGASLTVGDGATAADRDILDRLVERRFEEGGGALVDTPTQRAEIRRLLEDVVAFSGGGATG